MKLLWCDMCYSVIQINPLVWSKCRCGKVGGQYNEDEVTATIGGDGRVFGIANPFFFPEWIHKSDEDRTEFRNKYYPEGQGSDCWWGNYKGDVQLFWIKAPEGPRIEVQSKLLSRIRKVEVRVLDKRSVKIAGYSMKKVRIPASHGTVVTFPEKYRIGRTWGERLPVTTIQEG
jgi:hypothetical protein